jgi:outer membrane protein OmpA-like peptidoglycan-associated protein
MNQLTSILLSLSLIFIVSHTSAQTDKGYDYLKKKDYDQAEQAFRVDLDDPVDGVAAKVGLAECYQGLNNSILQLAEGLDHLRAAKDQYSKLDSKAKAKIAKYGVSLNKFSSLEKSLQKAAIQQVQDSRSVLKLDTLREKINPLHPSLQKDLDRTRMEVVQHAVRNAEDYLTLSSLLKNYYVLIASTNYRYARELQERLLTAFLNDYGPGQLSRFVAEQPKHSFSIDCWVDEFIVALNDRSASGLLRFLMRYPLSTLDVAANLVLKRKTGDGMFFPDRYILAEEENAYFQVLVEGWALENELTESDSLSSDFLPSLISHLEQAAPASRAYEMMKKSLQKYLTNRQWPEATSLITKSKPLFPDGQPDSCETRYYYYSEKQPWFKVAIPLVENEAEGIVRSPVNPVNTEDGDEFSPVISVDGTSLYFAATGREENIGGEDIFVSRFDIEKREWTKPELVVELSSQSDESPMSMTSDGNQMLMFRDGKLHISTLTARGWSPPVRMPDNINSFPWIGRAALSAKGDVMIFAASEDPEEIYGQSNIDLYITHKDGNGKWSDPKLLSPDVNTLREERAPFLHYDQKTLYFSSNGHGGLGGMDVFYTQRLDDTWENWSVPKNLGKEINTLEDDWGYNYSMSPLGNTVYMSSDEMETGLGDIFSTGLPDFVAPQDVVPVRGRIESDSDQPVATTVIVTDAETGEVIDEVATRPDGSFTLVVPGDKKVNYHVKDDSLFPVSGTIDPAQRKDNPFAEDTVQTIRLTDMLEKDKPAPLNNILFDFDKAVLKPQSFPELLRVFQIVKNETWLIEIEGHTDNQGTPEYNKNLSLQRAAAVKSFLESKGIAPARMAVQGYGAERPVTENDTEEGRAKNRRVEIRFRKS